MRIYKQTIQTEIQLRVAVASALFRITNPPVSCNTVTQLSPRQVAAK